MREFLRSAASALLILPAIFLSLTCKDEITVDELNKIVFPTSNVKYSLHVDPLFRAACAIPGGCHAGEDAAGNLSLESYQDLYARSDVYIRGDPENSLIIRVIEGREPGIQRMPINRPPLNSNQITGLKTWIKEGAQDN